MPIWLGTQQNSICIFFTSACVSALQSCTSRGCFQEVGELSALSELRESEKITDFLCRCLTMWSTAVIRPYSSAVKIEAFSFSLFTDL
uniref:Putative secreted protein n=1 Tax=Ixodes ricinus TaxID=34613 RepID=A0A6B0U5Y3_IXORI